MADIRIVGGKGSRTADVSLENRLRTETEANSTSFFISVRDKACFNTVSVDAAAAANDYIFYFKNTSTTKLFFVELISVSSASAATFLVWEVTGTAAGTSLTPKNMNLTSSATADATAVGDGAVTGLTVSGNEIATASVAASGQADIPFADTLVLGNGSAIAVEYHIGAGATAEVTMRGYYKLESTVT